MDLPKLKEYFYAAQLRYILYLCKPDYPNYTAKWKEMEKEFGEYPIQNIVKIKKHNAKKHMDLITLFTLELWFKIA